MNDNHGGFIMPNKFVMPIKYKYETGKDTSEIVKRAGFVAAFCRFVYRATGDRFSYLNGYQSVETDEYRAWLSKHE